MTNAQILNELKTALREATEMVKQAYEAEFDHDDMLYERSLAEAKDSIVVALYQVNRLIVHRPWLQGCGLRDAGGMTMSRKFKAMEPMSKIEERDVLSSFITALPDDSYLKPMLNGLPEYLYMYMLDDFGLRVTEELRGVSGRLHEAEGIVMKSANELKASQREVEQLKREAEQVKREAERAEADIENLQEHITKMEGELAKLKSDLFTAKAFSYEAAKDTAAFKKGLNDLVDVIEEEGAASVFDHDLDGHEPASCALCSARTLLNRS